MLKTVEKRNSSPGSQKTVSVLSDKQTQLDEESRTIRGRVVAELGPFKSFGRGQFTMESLQKIVELGNAKKNGLRSRWRHPGLSDDGLGKFLGRDRNFRLDGDKVRSDFTLSQSAMKAPPDGGGTPYGEYILELSRADPEALSSSLVLDYKSEYLKNADGSRKKDQDGNDLPPVWIPTELHAIDVVDTGDAVHNGFLSADQDSENNRLVRQGAELINSYFDTHKIERGELAQRLDGFKQKILANLYGEDEMSETALAEIKKGQEELAASLKALPDALAKSLEGALAGIAKNKQETEKEPKIELVAGELKSFEGDESLKIVALCNLSNRPEMALGFLSQGMKIDQVKAELEKLGKKDSQLSDDNTGSLNLENKGGKKKPTIEEQLSAEYEEGAEAFAKLGITKANYIRDRKIELGHAEETAAILKEENGSHKAATIS